MDLGPVPTLLDAVRHAVACCAEQCRPRLCDELDNTARFLDLSLGVFAEISRADDERDLWEATLAEDLAVTERNEVENRGRI